MVSVLDSGAVGPGFKSQPRRCWVTTPIVPLHQAAKLVAALSRVARVTAGLAESNAGFMTHVTCRLTAKNRDQLRNPTLGMGYLYLFNLRDIIVSDMPRLICLKWRLPVFKAVRCIVGLWSDDSVPLSRWRHNSVRLICGTTDRLHSSLIHTTIGRRPAGRPVGATFNLSSR